MAITLRQAYGQPIYDGDITLTHNGMEVGAAVSYSTSDFPLLSKGPTYAEVQQALNGQEPRLKVVNVWSLETLQDVPFP